MGRMVSDKRLQHGVWHGHHGLGAVVCRLRRSVRRPEHQDRNMHGWRAGIVVGLDHNIGMLGVHAEGAENLHWLLGNLQRGPDRLH